MMISKVAFICYLINAVGLLVIGLVYGLRNEFMPYHADVIQMSWSQLNEPFRVLYIGMMRTEAAGFLSSAVAILVLLFIPFWHGKRWSSWAITSIGIVEFTPSLFATYHISNVTSASPPWQLLLLGNVLLIIGLAMSEIHKRNLGGGRPASPLANARRQ